MIRVGARRSPLAVAQAQWVAGRITAAGHACELVGIDSLGDVDRRRLTDIGGTGIFATAVREQLLAGRIDVAVHSLKDLPVDPAPGLVVAAMPAREDVRDVLVGLPVEQWRDGTVIGTGSPRRAVQLEAIARQRGVLVHVVPVRGNVDTRLDLVREGTVDATVLAAAGLLRLGRFSPVDVTTGLDESQPVLVGEVAATLLSLGQMLPAAGQGSLAVEARAEMSDELREALALIDDADTRAAVTAERQFLSTMEAGCLAPVGAHASVAGDGLTLTAVVGKESGSTALLRTSRNGQPSDPQALGRELAGVVLAQLDEKMD